MTRTALMNPAGSGLQPCNHTRPMVTAAQVIAVNGPGRCTVVPQSSKERSRKTRSRSGTRGRIADDLPDEYLIILLPIALFVLFAVFAFIIAWSS
jgi:hypothetical protein